MKRRNLESLKIEVWFAIKASFDIIDPVWFCWCSWFFWLCLHMSQCLKTYGAQELQQLTEPPLCRQRAAKGQGQLRPRHLILTSERLPALYLEILAGVFFCFWAGYTRSTSRVEVAHWGHRPCLRSLKQLQTNHEDKTTQPGTVELYFHRFYPVTIYYSLSRHDQRSQNMQSHASTLSEGDQKNIKELLYFSSNTSSL